MGFLFRVPLSRIGIRPGRRPIDAAHVANLEVSFQEIGQRTPIGLNLVAPDDPARDLYTYWLNAGGHRLTAARNLGWADMDAILDDDDALTARIAEVDENLLHRGYTALERAQALNARLEAWAARHPERVTAIGTGAAPKRGRPKNSGTAPEFGGVPAIMGFTAEAAAKSGLSEETVRRDLAVYRGIPASLQGQLAGTAIASNPGALRQLATIGGGEELEKVVAALLDGRAKTVSEARTIASGKPPITSPKGKVDRLADAQALWRRMTASERRGFLDFIAPQLPAGWTLSEDQA